MRRTAICLIALGLAACNNPRPTATTAAPSGPAQPGSQRVSSPDGETQGEVIGTPAPGSKFSRVRMGMSLRQVTDLIGEPSDTASHITGKAFIPFYFGGDTSLTETFYKGEGQLSFAPASFGSSALKLVRVIVDRSEQGYAH